MDLGERHAYGAHFTSQADIALVVGPTIVDPWRARIDGANTIADFERLLIELANFKVLDPACGSGNFLYVAYREIRRLERDIHQRIAERRRSGPSEQGMISFVPTANFYGIDNNEFAVEIAKVTMMLAKSSPLMNCMIISKFFRWRIWTAVSLLPTHCSRTGRRLTLSSVTRLTWVGAACRLSWDLNIVNA